jgi:acetylornithine deacetylase/succinyl-diaminopimelate desuccinylase-like protein
MTLRSGGSGVAAADEFLRAAWSRHLEELKAFLRIPSVSALPSHEGDIQRAADWLADRLRTVGVPYIAILSTGRHPVVVGTWEVDARKPTVTIYGHYDVQPVDPLDDWESPPFDPVIRDGRLYARGASDDKGNLYSPVRALEAIANVDGKPPLNVKLMFEGEEEIGSPSLLAFFEAHGSEVAAALALSADGQMLSADAPSITIGSRGLIALDIEVRGADTDLHSGIHGGAVANPIHGLTALVASLHDRNGRVLVDGFYDAVQPLTADDLADMQKVGFDEADYVRSLGVTELFGEAGYTALGHRWLRPTAEVNGIWGGFQGTGIKTVLPGAAFAKLTCRLVPNQEPDDILARLEDHLRRRVPKGLTMELHRHPGSARPYAMSRDHPALMAARQVLRELYQDEPVFVRTGGTLPVAEMFWRATKTPTLFFSFGAPDSNVHAPNEFIRLSALERGARAYYRLLHSLADAPPS